MGELKIVSPQKLEVSSPRKIIPAEGYDQHEIIRNIIHLHTGDIELDPTYSKGNFYKKGGIKEPRYKSDINPINKGIIEADAKSLPFKSGEIRTIMFDPPFLVKSQKGDTGIICKRFDGFQSMKKGWQWYDECLAEFHRVLKPRGYLIFKCMDTVSGGKQWWSCCHIINEAEKQGFCLVDLFLLYAKHRMKGHNHAVQHHARKFHSYFLVFQKQRKGKDCSTSYN